MKSKNNLIVASLIFTAICSSCKSNDTEIEKDPVGDSVKKAVVEKVKDTVENKADDFRNPLNIAQSFEDSLEILLKKFLIPNIELMYRAAFNGSWDDNFSKLKNELGNNFVFISGNDLLSWDNLLGRIKILFEETGSKYNIEFWSVKLRNGYKIPTVVI